MTRRPTRTLLALLLLPFVWMMAGTQAFAHDRLQSTTPSSGATVTMPARVQLKFSGTVVSTGSRVKVTGPNQKIISGELAVSGDTVSVPLAPGAAAGAYRVVWRVTSADGHPVSGNFEFEATAAPASSTSTSGASSAPSTGTSSTSTSTPVPTQQVPTNDTNNEPGWIIGGVAVAALAIGASVIISRRRLTDDEPADGSADSDD